MSRRKTEPAAEPVDRDRHYKADLTELVLEERLSDAHLLDSLLSQIGTVAGRVVRQDLQVLGKHQELAGEVTALRDQIEQITAGRNPWQRGPRITRKELLSETKDLADKMVTGEALLSLIWSVYDRSNTWEQPGIERIALALVDALKEAEYELSDV